MDVDERVESGRPVWRCTELRERLLPVTFPGRDCLPLVGPMRLEISGSSVGLESTQPGQWDTSTTCGSTARANGRGWAGRTLAMATRARGSYGTKGTPAPGNVPGARWLGASVGRTRPEISGSSVGSVTTRLDNAILLNDLWEYSAGQWTWMSGSNAGFNQGGTYGTQGTACPRQRSWVRDRNAVELDRCVREFVALRWLWLRLRTGNLYIFNDLWKYSAGEWTWIGGSNTLSTNRVRTGLRGLLTPNNIPGARCVCR